MIDSLPPPPAPPAGGNETQQRDAEYDPASHGACAINVSIVHIGTLISYEAK